MLRSKILLSFFLFVLLPFFTIAQELFPHNEPASNIPKGVLGFRLSNNFYDEQGELRSWQGYKFMWGLSSNWMITPMFSFSNHHGQNLPANFVSTEGNIGAHTHGGKKGNKYPYAFEGFGTEVKYRFLNIDTEHEHFRMASYLNAAFGSTAHDEAEPSLMGDNSGVSAGLIATWLKNKFAVSINTGYLLPLPYYDSPSKITIEYGNAVFYNLSMGYLLFPFKYKSYNQTNLNLYCEFLGKKYGKASVQQNSNNVLIENAPGLEGGDYIEVHPSLQLIIKSNTRFDISAGFPLVNRSHARTYPLFYLGIQRYFYF